MTDLAIRQDNTPALMIDPTGGRLVAWAQAASAANSLAKAVCTTAFVPAHFRDNPGDTTAAILLGDELGMSPLNALRGIYVVHGTPALYARTMVALALSHGHQVWTEKSTDTEVVVCGKRAGSDHSERSVWTIARATKAGYTNNKKYASNPQEMLWAKAASEVAKKVAADVLAGVPYSVEDLELEDQPTTTVTRATTKVARRKPEPAPEPPEPSFDEPDPAPEPQDVSEAVELIRPQQMKMMQALFTEKGFTDRDDKLSYVTDIVGIDVESSKDLTVAQASSVIDALTKLDDQS